jgi:hypothetical protein
MQLKYFCHIAIFIVAISACSKYETQYEGPYSDADNTNKIEYPHEVLVAQGGNVYLFDRRLSRQKELENTPVNVQKASINFNHDLIACWAPGQDIVVLDSSGVEQGTVPNTEQVDWFDWHPNNQTLVILRDGIISLYGPNVDVVDTDLNDAFPAFSIEKKITAATVSPNGTVFFNYTFYTAGNYYNRIGIKQPTGVGLPLLIQELYPDLEVSWMRVDAESENIAFGGNTSFGRITYIFNYPSLQLYDLGSRQFIAFSPDDWSNLYLYANRMEYESSNGFYYDFNSTEPVTALDW